MDHVLLKRFFSSENSPSVHFERVNSLRYVEAHDHEFYEIAVVLDGTAVHVSKSVSLPASRGDIFVIPVGTVHSWQDSDALRLLNIYYRSQRFIPIVGASDASSALQCLFFSSDFFDNEAMKSAVNFRIGEDTRDLVIKELNEYAAQSFMPPNLQNVFNAGCFLKILSHLAFEYSVYHALPSVKMPLRPYTFRLLEVLDQCAANGNNPNIATEAGRLGVSVEHLTRRFTEEIGIPPFRYFGKRRLEHAGNLVKNSYLNNTEIAFKMGFSSSAHFSREFKKYYNVSPTAFKHCAKVVAE